MSVACFINQIICAFLFNEGMLCLIWLLQQNLEPYIFCCASVVMLCFVTGFPCWWLWAASSSERTLPILSIIYKGLGIWEHWRNGSVNIAICILMVWFATHNRRHILHYNMVLYYPDGKRKFFLEHVTWKCLTEVLILTYVRFLNSEVPIQVFAINWRDFQCP